MAAPVKPEMAYPTFASATITFSPAKWPALDGGGVEFRRFEADGRTAAGLFIRQASPIKERLISIKYELLSTADRDAFAAADGGGFFHTVDGASFEYKDTDAVIYTVRFVSAFVESVPAGYGRWSLSSIEMVVVT